MQHADLEVFNKMPFYFWVKDDTGKYVWVNQALSDAAGVQVVGKTDNELPWSASAESLQADDRRVQESGEPLRLVEQAVMADGATKSLNVCKFIGEFDGKRCTCGVSFQFD